MAHKIIEKIQLNESIYHFKIEAEEIAGKILPGQFVILRIDEKGERIPLTVYNNNPGQGIIELIVQNAGATTFKLCNLKENSQILDVIGPLGIPTEIKKYGKIICIGGGVGIAEIFPLARALKNLDNDITSIIGVRNKKLLILENEMYSVSNKLFVTTDDGSYGRRGFVSDILKEFLERECFDIVFAVGPIPMMKIVAQITKPFNLKTIVSLNSIMVDGTGMCGSCRVTIGNKVKFVCVDGPDFDAHLVDFNELSLRQTRFWDMEQICLEKIKAEHKKCHRK